MPQNAKLPKDNLSKKDRKTLKELEPDKSVITILIDKYAFIYCYPYL